MAVRRGPTVADLLWLVAYLGLLMAALASPPGVRGTLAVTVATAILWLVELVTMWRTGGAAPAGREIAFLVLNFTVFLAWDALACQWMLEDRAFDLAARFGTAAAFALMATITATRRSPRDIMLLAQIAFLVATAVPGIGVPLWYLAARPAGAPGAEIVADRPASHVGQIAAVLTIFLPLVFACGLMATLVESVQSRDNRSRVWQILAIGQACWILQSVLTSGLSR